MSERIKFHVDENVKGNLVEVLRQRGADVTTAADAGLLSAADDDHLAFALKEGRVIFTHDDDFLAFDAQGMEHAGIVYCRMQTKSVRQIVSHLMLMRDCMTPEEMIGRVEFV